LRVRTWRSIAATALAVLNTSCLAAPRYPGPRSNHFDGERFSNVVPAEEHSLWDILRWQLTRDAADWPDFVETARAAQPPSGVRAGALRVTFVNHATLLIQFDGVNVLTDPVWSDRVGPLPGLGPRRHKPPGVRFTELPPIHAVLISHNHYDHLDLPTLRQLAREHQPVFLAGLGTAQLLANAGITNARDLDWWQTTLVRGIPISFVPAQHWSTRNLTDRNRNLWGGFVIESTAGPVYFAGDTGFGPHFETIGLRFGSIRLALLPIGAYAPEWFMAPHHISPRGAVKAHRALRAKLSIPIHWGTFQQSDEGMYEPVRELHRALSAEGIASEAFAVLDNGGVWDDAAAAAAGSMNFGTIVASGGRRRDP
jgi:L-ascorbate metabolism protein UlaG (beta-lactamase superfamily)